jgi:thiamine pyrophosphokinase
MSSHHIVREKQEPALLITGLDNFADELLGQLLEWSPTVITTLQTAEQLVAYGIKIDWIITDDADEVEQSDVKLIPRGIHSVIDAALKFLLANEYSAVNIITDELTLSDYSHFTGNIDLVIFYQHRKIYPVSSGFSKWKPGGEIIEILSTSKNAVFRGLSSVDLVKYITTADGFFSLYFDEAFLFIAEDI